MESYNIWSHVSGVFSLSIMFWRLSLEVQVVACVSGSCLFIVELPRLGCVLI